jgi:hypothetical protein
VPIPAPAPILDFEVDLPAFIPVTIVPFPPLRPAAPEPEPSGPAYITNDLKAFFFEQFPDGSGDYDITITGPNGSVPLDVLTADPGYFSVHIKEDVPDGTYVINVQDLQDPERTETLTLIVRQQEGIPEPELITLDQQQMSENAERVFFSSVNQPTLTGKTSAPAEIAIFSELLQQTFVVQTDSENNFVFVYPETMVAGVRDHLTVVARYPNDTLSREQTIEVEYIVPKPSASIEAGYSCPVQNVFCGLIATLILLFVTVIIGHFFLFPSILNSTLMLRTAWIQGRQGREIRFVFALILIAALLGLSIVRTFAVTSTPLIVNYQGVLKNAAGTPITAAQTFRFSLWLDSDYDAPADFDGAGAIPVAAPGFSSYQEVQTVTPDANGFFQVQIGSVTPVPNFNIASHLFLQVEVKPSASANTAFESLDLDGVANGTDRQPLGSLAYANNADFIDYKEIGTGVDNIAVLGPGGLFSTSLIPGGTNLNNFVIDADDTGGDVNLQFGTTLNESLKWDDANQEFDLSDDLNITGGLQTSGPTNFAASTQFRLRESPNPTTSAACTSVNELIVNTTLNRLEICTVTGGAGAATWLAIAPGDATSLSGLLAGQFLRSDATDNYTSGTLTTDSGTTLSVLGNLNASGATQARIRESANPTTSAACTVANEIIINTTLNRIEICTVPGIAGAATWIVPDAGTIDGLDSTSFVRTDASSTITTGTLTLNAGTTLTNNGTTNINGTAVIGDGGDVISVNSSSWDISGPGVASGFTGISSSGAINFSSASTYHGPEGAVDPALCTVGELFFNTTSNTYKVCTATNTWTIATGPGGADLLDSLDSTQFLRSDATDNYTSGTLSTDPGTTLAVNGAFNASASTALRLRESANPTTSAACGTLNELIVNTTANRIEICTATGIAGSATWTVIPAGNALTLNSLTSGQFVRTDASSTITTGTLTLDPGTTLTNNGTTNLNGTTNINGAAVIGDGGDTIAIDSGTWDISGPGVISGLTGMSSTGVANFSASSSYRIREVADEATASCTTVKELLIDTTENRLYVCTVVGAPGTWVGAGSGDAQTLDTLDSASFLRSDSSDNFTSGTLTTDSGTTLTVNGIINTSAATQFRIRENSDPNTNSACASIGELIFNTTSNQLMRCTTIGAPGTWTNVDTTGGTSDFEAVYTNDADKVLMTSGGNFTIDAGAGIINAKGITNINASNNTATNIGTGTTTSTVSIGGGSNSVAIDSSSWDVSSAGVITGVTGLTSTGSVNLSGTSATRLRESANPTTSAACATVNELIVNTTFNRIEICTVTGGAGAATWIVADAGTLDGIDSTQFLRSDTSDNYTSGTLTFDNGTTLTVNGTANVGDGGDSVAVNSSTWDISAVGVGSGFTGFSSSGTVSSSGTLSSTGVVDFSTATSFKFPQGAADPGTCSVGQAFYNTTSNTLKVCTVTNTWTVAGPQDFEAVYAYDADKVLTTSNGNYTIDGGSGTVAINGVTNINTSNNRATNIGTGTTTSGVTIGGGSNTVAISSSNWGVSSAGVASGLTGVTSTGTVNLSGSAALRLRESANPTTSAACATVNELIVNTTFNRIEICTATGIAGSATWIVIPAGDASTLSSLTASQFLRSDTSDNYTSGTLTFDAGTTVVGNGDVNLSSATSFGIPKGATDPATCTVGQVFFNTTSAGLKLCTATNTWSPTLRTDASQSITAGTYTFNAGTTLVSNGDVNFSGATRFATPSGAATPGTCTKGDLYFSTTINNLLVCTATNTFTAAGPYNKSLVYEPVYADSVIQPDGTTNNGTLESFFVDTDGDPGNNNFNYYRWTSTKTSLHDNDLVIRFQIPEGFISFQATPIQFIYKTDTASTADNRLDVSVEDSAGAAVTLTGASALAATSYTTASITFSGSPTFTAGQSITIHVKLSAKSTGGANAAKLKINYYGQ